jgi:hypothetical protein
MVFLIENYIKISQNYSELDLKNEKSTFKVKPDESSSNTNLFGEHFEASNMLTINTNQSGMSHSLSTLSSGYSSVASSSLSSCSSSATCSLSYFPDDAKSMPRTKSESTATTCSEASAGGYSDDDCFNLERDPLSPATSEHSATSQELPFTTNLELISEICVQIEKNNELESSLKFKNLKTSRTFWQYLINKLDLLHLLGRNETQAFYTSEKNEFLINLGKLLLCVTRIESVLAEKAYENFEALDSDLVLSLGFLFYEQAILMINTTMCSSVSPQMVFEIDLSISCMSVHQSVVKFEKYLTFLIENYLIKYIPELKNDDMSTQIVDFYRDMFAKTQIDSLVSLTEESSINSRCVMDVEMFLMKPHAQSESIDFMVSNPITQSFKSLLTNLNKLNLCSSDPFREACEEANLFGRQLEQLTYACFFLSYYTSGLASGEDAAVAKVNMFDSPMQFLYELKQFNGEFESLFKYESISDEWKKSMIESLRGDYDQYVQFYEHDLNSKAKVICNLLVYIFLYSFFVGLFNVVNKKRV